MAKGSSKPNILIIYADDLGYGDLAIQNPDSEIPTSHYLGDTEQGMSKGDWTN
jgi:arylsulfatase A